MRRARVQGNAGGGVLSIFGGSATFELVEISGTSARGVRVAGGGRSGSAAEWGGGVQNGGVVMISGGSVHFKGGSIAHCYAVRDPRCCQLCVLH
jgi:hypothetical protein